MMKRFFNYALVFVLVGYMVPTMPMNNGVRNPLDAFMDNFANQNYQERMQREAQAMDRRFQQERVDARLRREQLRAAAMAGDQAARAELDSELRTNEALEKGAIEIGTGVAKFQLHAANAVIDMAVNRQQAEQRLQEEVGKAAVKAKEDNKANIEMAKEMRKWLTEPKTIAAVASVVGLTVLAGVQKFFKATFLKDGTIEAVNAVKVRSFAQDKKQLVFGKKIESKKISDVILSSELEKQIAEISDALKKAVVSDDFLPNILLWGPPGTGKTMIATRLARSAGIDYHIFPASSLSKYSETEALLRLQELFEDAKQKGLKLIIFIDEAENAFLDRNKITDTKIAKIVTQLLAYTGTESTDVCVIAATNRPEDLDEAFLTRCDYQLYVGTPDQTQRARIIKKYMTDYLLSIPPATRVPTLASRIWSIISKPKPKQRIAVAPEAVNDVSIQEIARLTDGFVGRDLSKMVFEMRRRALASPNKTLTKAMVDEVVARKLKERAQQDGGFKRKS